MERELRPHEDGHEVPAAYADVAEEYESDDEDHTPVETYEDLRKSG